MIKIFVSGLLSCASILSLTSVVLATSADSIQLPLVKSRRESCSPYQIREYVKKLIKFELNNIQFESIIKCNSILELKTVLTNDNSDVRASAAYMIGEISVRNRNFLAYETIVKHRESEKNINVLEVIDSYRLSESCPSFRGFQCAMSYDIVKRVETQFATSSPLICSLPGIRNIFPRCR